MSVFGWIVPVMLVLVYLGFGIIAYARCTATLVNSFSQCLATGMSAPPLLAVEGVYAWAARLSDGPVFWEMLGVATGSLLLAYGVWAVAQTLRVRRRSRV